MYNNPLNLLVDPSNLFVFEMIKVLNGIQGTRLRLLHIT